MTMSFRKGDLWFSIIFIIFNTGCAVSSAEMEDASVDSGYEPGDDDSGIPYYPEEDGGSDSDSDTDADADADSGMDASMEGVVCCESADQDWCPGTPTAGGPGCLSPAVIGRTNFSTSIYSQFVANVATTGLGNGFVRPPCDGTSPGGADTWFSIFLFRGEEIVVTPAITSWTNTSKGIVYILKQKRSNACSSLEPMECGVLKMLQQEDVKYRADESAWYAIIVDSPQGAIEGKLSIQINDCSYSQDCSCWMEDDEPSGADADADADASVDADADADVDASGDAAHPEDAGNDSSFDSGMD